MELLRKAMQQDLDMRLQLHPKAGVFLEFLLEQGIYFTGNKFKGRRMTAKQCFKNATHYALRSDGLYYCEGLALSGELVKSGLILPMEHAWCCDDEGNVYDPTWQGGQKNIYCGVAFDSRLVAEAVCLKKHYGLFTHNFRYDEDLFQHIRSGKFPTKKFDNLSLPKAAAS